MSALRLGARSWLALHAALLVPALLVLAALLRAFTGRVGFPADLEWLESSHLYQAYRMAHGMPVYAPPELGFCALPYPPLWFLIVGLAGRVVGLDFWLARSVSLLAILAGMLAVAYAVSRGWGSRAAGAVAGVSAAGAIAASYPALDGWFDLARVDSLATGLLLVSAALLVEPPRSRARLVASALVLSAAIYTKHPNVVPAAVLLGFTLLRDRRAGLRLAAAVLLVCGVALAALWLATDGWLVRWLTITSQHRVQPARARDALLTLLRAAPYLALVPVLLPLAALRGALRADALLFLLLLLAALPFAVLGFAIPGGAANNLMPPLALAPALTLLLLRDAARGAAPALRARAELAACAAAALFLLARSFSPQPFVPSEAERAAARALNAEIRALDGEVVAPSHPFMALRNGKGDEQVSSMGYADVIPAGWPGVDPRRDLARIGARWLLLSEPGPDGFIARLVRDDYARAGSLTRSPARTGGLRSTPSALYERRDRAGGAP